MKALIDVLVNEIKSLEENIKSQSLYCQKLQENLNEYLNKIKFLIGTNLDLQNQILSTIE